MKQEEMPCRMAGYFLLLSWDGIAPACRALIAPIEMATGKQADFCEKPNPLMMRQNPRLSPERRAGRWGRHRRHRPRREGISSQALQRQPRPKSSGSKIFATA